MTVVFTYLALIFLTAIAFVPCTGLLCAVHGQAAALSSASEECIGCHSTTTPAMVADWKKSRHASITPAEALKKPELQRRVSAEKIPENLMGHAVGCAECHMLNPETHKDVFSHNDRKVHLTVTPKDCTTCHAAEAVQYEKNMMSHARSNLANNPLFVKLEKSINGVQSLKDMKTTVGEPDEMTGADSCYVCHGTVLEVKGKKTRDTDAGEMEFPVLAGWPNQGVGRLNPDGSNGSCSACHPRHQFSIHMARKPYTCSKCHKGLDVPAYKAYSVSTHGALFYSLKDEWKFSEIPWTVGKDFTAPTCAGCHVSLVVSTEGDVVAKRTHQMNDRLPWRVLGLIYAHPHPKSPDTSIIRNKDGQPLPTALDGTPAAEFLISPEEQIERRTTLQKVCQSCHAKDWVNGHWERFENTIRTSNEMTRTATEIIQKAWDEKLADNTSLFDETVEKLWVEQWLFFANNTRFASAMLGSDHGVFSDGRWSMSKNVQHMLDHLQFLRGTKSKAGPAPIEGK
ncbi:MAG TPA: multiheme c-type cytochrome [Desulfomonilaceae bacterium]|nr:multiheme c-type cytochrome [Desulfomonilaceae bacterium]